ncbi:MAG: sugar phosphate isomerase/epimerase [Candidatus Latescibacteria bacterium]|nr:sugar phosphate isomerase/epimerase [Candidatus Latescibacterota bacterium]
MRLCWNDWFNKRLRDIKPEEAKTIHDIGYRVAGVNSGDDEATDDDIKRLKSIMTDYELSPGPYGAGARIFHPDPTECERHHKKLIKVLEIAGKLGCPTIRTSGGTFDLKDPWAMHQENHTQKSMDILVESTKKVIAAAEDNNVIICPETTQWTIIDDVERMKEFVDRCDSPCVKVVLDVVNHMNMQRVYESGRWMKCAIATLGDRIGVIHVKDVQVEYKLVAHLNETKMGTGLLDHAALMRASNQLEPWKTFSLEHIAYDYTKPDHVINVTEAYNHICAVADRIGHTFTDPTLTREKWVEMQKNNR